MILKSNVLFGSALVASCALFSCSVASPASSDEDAADERVSTAAAPILNGAPATDPKYAAVGALVWVFPEYGVVEVFCSGTLVSPTKIVTARHCTPNIDLASEIGVVAAFALGPDAFNPTQIIPITSYVNAPAAPGNQRGLLLDGGRDVSVASLESAPAGVTPVKLGEFQDSMLGTRFSIAGYGVRDSLYNYGLAFAGVATARAINGRWYELLFNGDYDAYRSWYFTDSTASSPTEAGAKDWWKTYELENKFELLAGGLPGEALGCYGDSGGPLLLGTTPSNITTYGVSFAVEGTLSTVCGLGGAYLVFNRRMLDFVRGEL